MNELQATLEFSVELYKFYNVDLFQRGLYQIRCALRVSPKLRVQIEVSVPEPGRGLGSASLAGDGYGSCRPFQILYRNEEISLRDVLFFRAHMLVDSRRLKESLERPDFSIILELWFAEQTPIGCETLISQSSGGMALVSTRTLQLNFSPVRGLHYHLPVLFDYFHLSAISITIHANLVALHQPYINTPRSAKPWLGSGKFSFRTPQQAQIHSSLEAVFFGGGNSAKCGGGTSATKLAQARIIHQAVCAVLLESYEALRNAFQESLSLLPQWQQSQLGHHGDVSQRLRKLGDLTKHLDVDEDFAARANSDIAQLCAENIVQWQHFLAAVCCKPAVHQHLAKKHHTLRVKRFAEAFFVLDNPRHSAAGCYDANYQNYLAISELARRSRYLTLLPSLPVHCVALDGDVNTIPIIFEDQYQDTVEFARRRSAGRKSGSDPFLSSGISEPSLLAQDDCSCGISAILEARSNSRAEMANVCESKLMHCGNMVQASLTIAPNASSHLQTSTLPARHSKSLDQLRINMNSVSNASTLPRSVLATTDIHKLKSRENHDSKYLNDHQKRNNGNDFDQHKNDGFNLFGGDNNRQTRSANHSMKVAYGESGKHRDGQRDKSEHYYNDFKPENRYGAENQKLYEVSYQTGTRRNNGSEYNREINDIYHKNYQFNEQNVDLYGKSSLNLVNYDKDVKNYGSGFQNSTLPRPILPPRNSYPPRSMNRSATGQYHASSAPNPQIVHSAPKRHIPRSNSTQIFPRSVTEFEVLFQNPGSIRHAPQSTKDLRVYSDAYHVSRNHLNSSNGCRDMRKGYKETLRKSANNILDMKQTHENSYYVVDEPLHQYQFGAPKTSSSRHKLNEKARQARSTGSSSSSTESDSIPSGGYKRLEGSASVPLQLGRTGEFLRHARSAASVLDEMFMNSTASTSESLPNLAPPPPAFESSPPPNRDPQSSSGSGSTSSLTSEQSGWVSSRRSSEPSSPDVPLNVSRKPIRYDVPNYAKPETRVTPESKAKSKYSNRNENRKFNTLLNGNEGRTNKNALNGEKLREKLQKLAAENSLKNSILNSKLNNSNSSNRHGNGPRKSSKTNRKSSINRSDNSKLSNRSNGDQKKSILVSDKEFILDVYKSHFLQQNDGDGSEPPPRISCSIQPISNSSNSLDPDRSLTSPLSIETSSLHPYIRKECPDVTLESDLLDELKAVADDDSSLKCEDLVDHPYEELRLPPPQQFRDVPPPPEPFRDPPPAPPLPVDNLLYHVYESVKCKEKKKHNTSEMMKSQSTSELADKLASIEPDEPPVHRKLLADEAEQAFVKARTEFKRQINFSGNLYSDFRTFASSLPYFHISDEYRMFSPEGLHLIICVHGLDGNSADLRLVKTYLELGLPGAHLEFLMSERNQGDTFSDFDTMTDRLVNEILYQIESCNLNPTRISFVGHSLGNIIIRSALTRPQMKPLLSRLHTFLSLSGPHLGTLYNSSGLVNMGMWFMQKWKKSGSLLQLCLRDAADVRQTFLYRLSQRSTLHYFKNVLLCGSSQDRYVPLHSARIELCKAAVRDGSILGCAYREMVHNIVSPMLARRDLTLVRYDVQHALPHTANALIGRAAHIAVLDSELFIEKFMVVAGLKYFR